MIIKFVIILFKMNKTTQKEIRVHESDFDFGQFYFSYAKYHYNPM